MSSFAAGFFGQLNDDITDQKQYIRARVDEDRTYLREQGLKRQAGIQEQRGQYEEVASSLIRRGADERTVLATLEMDPKGLMELYRRTDGDNAITGNNLNDMMTIAGDYRSESTMDEVLNSILPMSQKLPNDTGPVESRRRSIGSWLGLNVEDALSNEVYNQQIVGGMTGDQIMAGMNLPIQAKGSNVGGVTFDFAAGIPIEPLRISDVNTYIATANDDYDIDGMITSLQDQLTGELAEGDLDRINAEIVTLEGIDSMSGARRLSAILEVEGVEPGPNTLDIAGSPYGAQVFSAPGMSVSLQERIFSTITPADTSDDAVNASGLPSNPVATEVATPGVTASTLEGSPEGLLPLDTPAIPVTEDNVDQFVDSYFAANPDSQGIHVIFEGGTQPVLVTPDKAVESETPDLDFYESLLPADQTDFFGRRITTMPLSIYEAKPSVEQESLPALEELEVNPVADESLAVLEEVVTGIRPRARPEQTPESAEMAAAIYSTVEELNNPEISEALSLIIREQDLDVRDTMITEVVGMLNTIENIPANIEMFLLLLDTLRQPSDDVPIRDNPLTGLGRAPTQPTLLAPTNKDSNAPLPDVLGYGGATNLPSNEGMNTVSPARPGTGVDPLVNRHYDTLVNEDLRSDNARRVPSALEGSGVDQLVNSYYDMLVNQDLARNNRSPNKRLKRTR